MCTCSDALFGSLIPCIYRTVTQELFHAARRGQIIVIQKHCSIRRLLSKSFKRFQKKTFTSLSAIIRAAHRSSKRGLKKAQSASSCPPGAKPNGVFHVPVFFLVQVHSYWIAATREFTCNVFFNFISSLSSCRTLTISNR